MTLLPDGIRAENDGFSCAHPARRSVERRTLTDSRACDIVPRLFGDSGNDWRQVAGLEGAARRSDGRYTLIGVALC